MTKTELNFILNPFLETRTWKFPKPDEVWADLQINPETKKMAIASSYYCDGEVMCIQFFPLSWDGVNEWLKYDQEELKLFPMIPSVTERLFEVLMDSEFSQSQDILSAIKEAVPVYLCNNLAAQQ